MVVKHVPGGQVRHPVIRANWTGDEVCLARFQWNDSSSRVWLLCHSDLFRGRPGLSFQPVFNMGFKLFCYLY